MSMRHRRRKHLRRGSRFHRFNLAMRRIGEGEIKFADERVLKGALSVKVFSALYALGDVKRSRRDD